MFTCRSLCRVLILCCLTSCATNKQGQRESISPAVPSGSIDITTSYLGFRPSQVTFDNKGTAVRVPLIATESTLAKTNPLISTRLDRAKWYLAISRKMFWIGLGGAILSQVAESQNFVPARTTGNAFWGLGWTMWLGFLGLTEAEYDDAGHEYNSQRTADLRPSGGDASLSQFQGHMGVEGPRGGFVIGWQLIEF